MKRSVILSLLACAASVMCAAFDDVESVVANPGVDASTQVNISWAAHVPGTHIEYAEKANGQEAWKRVEPTFHRLCTTYDSIRSKSPKGQDIKEGVMFIKCAAELQSLKPATDYVYRVLDATGKVVVPVHAFKTAPAAGEWSCCVISDFHTYTPAPGRLKAAMDMVGTVEKYNPGIDWVLHLGDVAAWGGSWSFWVEMYKQPAFARYMWTGLNGNHDNMTRGYDKVSKDFFRDANYVPRNGYEGQEGVCYHFRYGEALFIALNNEEMRKDEQFAQASQWVRKVVTEARASSNPPRYVIVCEHYQWFNAVTGKTSQYGRWSPIFDELGVDLALSGNNHVYASTNALLAGKETDGYSGTVYVQTPSCDNERGQGMEDIAYNKDIIKYRWTEGDRTVGAMDMKVDDKHIVLTLLDRNGNILDTVEVKAKR